MWMHRKKMSNTNKISYKTELSYKLATIKTTFLALNLITQFQSLFDLPTMP